MKILKTKDWENSWSHQCTCRQCETVVEIEAKDLRHVPGQGDQRDYQPAYFAVQCPTCSEAIVVADTVIPAYLQKLARERSERQRTNYFDR